MPKGRVVSAWREALTSSAFFYAEAISAYSLRSDSERLLAA
jgi:hypothetical protein